MMGFPPHHRFPLEEPRSPGVPPVAGASPHETRTITSEIGNKFGGMRVDLPREFHVALVFCRVWCCGSREYHRSHRDRSHDKARPKPFLASMALAKCAQVLKATFQDGFKPPVWGNTGEFGAYLTVLRKRFAMTLHIL